jgi:rare lipoprotein A
MKAIIISLLLALPCFSEEVGIASHYSTNSGKKTANGEWLNPNAYTAAHKTLKFGTKVRVTNLKNNKSIIVRINDRGPFFKG